MKRKALWVTVKGNAATVDVSQAYTAHMSRKAADASVWRLNLTVMSAQVFELMQGGMSHTEAVQALAGKPVEAVLVEYMFKSDK